MRNVPGSSPGLPIYEREIAWRRARSEKTHLPRLVRQQRDLGVTAGSR